jgi:hypothetical protein
LDCAANIKKSIVTCVIQIHLLTFVNPKSIEKRPEIWSDTIYQNNSIDSPKYDVLSLIDHNHRRLKTALIFGL